MRLEQWYTAYPLSILVFRRVDGSTTKKLEVYRNLEILKAHIGHYSGHTILSILCNPTGFNPYHGWEMDFYYYDIETHPCIVLVNIGVVGVGGNS